MSFKDLLKIVSPIPRSYAHQKYHDTNWQRFCLLPPSMRQTLVSGTGEEVAQLLEDLKTRSRFQNVDLTIDREYIYELRHGQKSE